MKAHFFISMGFLLIAIFFVRGLDAVMEPGIGLREIYILGGFLLAGLLIRAGWALMFIALLYTVAPAVLSLIHI